jgi:hypothetical protein
MALTMLDKQAESSNRSAWSSDLAAELECERKNPNPCVGNILVSESDRVRVWMIRLAPGERIGLPPPRARLFLDLNQRRACAPVRERRHHG